MIKNHYHRLSVWQTDCSHGWAGTRKLVNVYFHLHEFSFLLNEVNLCPVFEDTVFKFLSYFKLCICSVCMGVCVHECRDQKKMLILWTWNCRHLSQTKHGYKEPNFYPLQGLFTVEPSLQITF